MPRVAVKPNGYRSRFGDGAFKLVALFDLITGGTLIRFLPKFVAAPVNYSKGLNENGFGVTASLIKPTNRVG